MAEHQRNGQIMMTYRCSAACRHCLVMAHPRQEATLVTTEDAVAYARDFAELNRHVILAGGEALLFFDHVVATCRAIMAAGVPIRFIESNGSWCTSDQTARDGLLLLRDSGVRGMYFSIDAYHQEFVPAERVCRGVAFAREIFGEEHVHAPRTPLEEARKLEGIAGNTEALRSYARAGRVRHFGRAADALAPSMDAVPVEELLRQDCQEGLDVDNLFELQVDPFGYTRPDLCPGVNLGNTRSARLRSLATTKHVRETPLLSDIAERGPAALLARAEQSGFAPRDSYVSKCHLCFEIRRHLVASMPDELRPPHLYQVVSD